MTSLAFRSKYAARRDNPIEKLRFRVEWFITANRFCRLIVVSSAATNRFFKQSLATINQKVNSRSESMTRIFFSVGLILTFPIAVAGQASSGVVVSGVVLNTSEEVIPGASVSLRRNDGAKPPTVVASDTRGAFRFSQVASGDYEIEIRKPSFKSAVIQLAVGAQAPTPLRIVLGIPDLIEEVAV